MSGKHTTTVVEHLPPSSNPLFEESLLVPARTETPTKKYKRPVQPVSGPDCSMVLRQRGGGKSKKGKERSWRVSGGHQRQGREHESTRNLPKTPHNRSPAPKWVTSKTEQNNLLQSTTERAQWLLHLVQRASMGNTAWRQEGAKRSPKGSSRGRRLAQQTGHQPTSSTPFQKTTLHTLQKRAFP